MTSDSPSCQISAPDLEMGEADNMAVCRDVLPSAQPTAACPSCGKLLSIRVLAEKHHCDRKPRKPWKMDPERLLERRKLAAAKRFETRMAQRRSSLESDLSAVGV